MPRAGVPRTRWQLTHDCARKTSLPSAAAASSTAGWRSCSSQRSKSAGLSTTTPQQHVGVLRATILGALADVQTRSGRSGTRCGSFGRESGRSCLPAAAPKSCGRRRPISGSGIRAAAAPSLAGRHVQFVGRDEAQRPAVVMLVDVFPPPLPAHDRDEQGLVARLWAAEDRRPLPTACAWSPAPARTRSEPARRSRPLRSICCHRPAAVRCAPLPSARRRNRIDRIQQHSLDDEENHRRQSPTPTPTGCGSIRPAARPGRRSIRFASSTSPAASSTQSCIRGTPCTDSRIGSRIIMHDLARAKRAKRPKTGSCYSRLRPPSPFGQKKKIVSPLVCSWPAPLARAAYRRENTAMGRWSFSCHCAARS